MHATCGASERNRRGPHRRLKTRSGTCRLGEGPKSFSASSYRTCCSEDALLQREVGERIGVSARSSKGTLRQTLCFTVSPTS